MRVSDAVHGGGIDLDVVGIERLPVALQNPGEPIPIGAGDELFRQRRHSFLYWNRAGIPQSLGERAREPTHFVAAFFTFLDTHGDAHKLVGPRRDTGSLLRYSLYWRSLRRRRR